ncbi:hypothetical protein ONE63_001745 [Megalurothrips usitatus]|uniref:Sodium channel protein Nach-like n=1 Tax=Megalurothrips usitatus TaxID=439358 RepID=A0AAV7XA82_9NEOP|nr:hypothetical protein ONE63_001745 [Megalurothrips usitatus]
MHAIRQTASEFSENTSIHGVRYITENGRRWIERFLWIATEVVCVGCAVYMLMYFLTKFNTNPTMTRVESYFHDVANVPFPAITLCNVNRIFRSKAQHLVDSLNIPEGFQVARQDIINLVPLLGQLLAVSELGTGVTGRSRLERLLKYNNLSSEAVFEELGQPCLEMIERCSWEGREVNCSTIFTRTMTYLGYCCSFNSQRDFSLPPSPSDTKQTTNTAFFGYPLGLTVLLNPRTEDYFWGPFASAGVVCMVHDSNEIATERAAQAMVSIERESLVQVLPSLRNGTAALRDVSPERRRCLFENENPNSETAEYSHEDCTLECEAEKIWKMCACRPMSLPRVRGPKGKSPRDGPIPCNVSPFSDEKHDMTVKSQVRGDLVPTNPVEAEVVSEQKFQDCGCLAQCNSVDYELETTTANFGASRWVRRHFYQDMNATSRSLLHVYFDSQTSALFVNDLVSNPVQLMSSLGGIFSLFLGCSFMSAVEVIYFFTVRLWLLVRGDGGVARGQADLTPGAAANISPPYM